MRVRTVVVAWLLLVTPAVPAAGHGRPLDDTERRSAETSPGAAAVVYLVRHAEKVDPYPEDPGDPPLTEAGRERARALARVLANAPVERILSTDFRRTRDTAAPLAEALGLAVETYDPRALEDLARHLAESGQQILVVGHSNTTPRLVELLGGEPGPPIDEPGEHDRLYVLVLPAATGPVTVRMRYGEPSPMDGAPEAPLESDRE